MHERLREMVANWRYAAKTEHNLPVMSSKEAVLRCADALERVLDTHDEPTDDQRGV